MMSRLRETRPDSGEFEYSYRRTLGVRELIPAVGVGVIAGLAAFYVTKLFLEKTPLDVAHSRDDAASESSPQRTVSAR